MQTLKLSDLQQLDLAQFMARELSALHDTGRGSTERLERWQQALEANWPETLTVIGELKRRHGQSFQEIESAFARDYGHLKRPLRHLAAAIADGSNAGYDRWRWSGRAYSLAVRAHVILCTERDRVEDEVRRIDASEVEPAGRLLSALRTYWRTLRSAQETVPASRLAACREEERVLEESAASFERRKKMVLQRDSLRVLLTEVGVQPPPITGSLGEQVNVHGRAVTQAFTESQYQAHQRTLETLKRQRAILQQLGDSERTP